MFFPVSLQTGGSHAGKIIMGTSQSIVLSARYPRLCEKDLGVFRVQPPLTYRFVFCPDVGAQNMSVELGKVATGAVECAWGPVDVRQIAASCVANDTRNASADIWDSPIHSVVRWSCWLHRWRNVCGSIQRSGS